MKATIVDLRYRMKDVLRAIDRGETVSVLYRGKEKARLVPSVAASSVSGNRVPETKDQPFFGLWRDRDDMDDPASYVRNLRQLRVMRSHSRARKSK
jgi:antitoxin (DNA-binding transcriptional repressor) of toxin-antitoxin stability system